MSKGRGDCTRHDTRSQAYRRSLRRIRHRHSACKSNKRSFSRIRRKMNCKSPKAIAGNGKQNYKDQGYAQAVAQIGGILHNASIIIH